MTRSRRGLSMFLAALSVVTVLSVTGTQAASANDYGRLGTPQARCMYPGPPPIAEVCVDIPQMRWGLEIVHYVGDSPRYRVRSTFTNTCLVAFASSGDVGMYRCNSAWNDQVWAFQYVTDDSVSGLPLYWLRNKHSGRCLALNPARRPEAFMTTCANYRDQLWFAPR